MRRLVDEGFDTSTAANLLEARAALAAAHYDLVLVDMRLPDGDGLELVGALEKSPHTAVVLVTGHASVDSAVRAFRKGVTDYLTKPVDLKRLAEILARVRETLASRQGEEAPRSELRDAHHFADLVGGSQEMQKIYDLIVQVAATDSTALILGETGTGKDVVARTIHSLSTRASKPFVATNVAALSSTLIESELFGHEKGSFTGAERTRKGVFEQAHRGTVFLDEIAETPLELQPKLLRVLENHTLTRVGGEHPISVDVRVIAATNRDLHAAVAAGRVRADLLYRLLVFPIQMPPLRGRTGDVELLAQHFVREHNERTGTHKRLRGGALSFLKSQPWPGNVRELKHTIERAYIVAGEEIDVSCFVPAAEVLAPSRSAHDARDDDPHDLKSLAETETRHILRTLTLVDGDKPRAAAILGVSLKTLYNRLKRINEPRS